ncbi:MAG: glutamine synthetase [Gammaproteobacteria bacterium]|nr:glutamine synthetase [Gammaproteobacteria bacterium]
MSNQDIEQQVTDLPEQLQEWLAGRIPDEVECVVPDIVGIGRGKAMPARKFFKNSKMFLPSSIFYQTITGAYAEVDVENAWTEADHVLRPDFSTARSVPWTSDVTFQIISDLYTHDGQRVGVAPRNVLRRVLDLYAAEGWYPVVAPELEFYLTQPNTDYNTPVKPPYGRSGRMGVGRQTYSISGVDEYERVVDLIYDYAEEQGLEIDTVMQEGGAGQLEINLNHGDPLNLADQVFYFKRTIREAALRNECYATFMAKPMEDEPGSAMHIHQSVVDKDGNNLFSNADGTESDLFWGFLGGQQKLLSDVVCILAPFVNSYRRLVPDDAAPINLEWGTDNRSTGLRVPISDPAARRVENRVAGMDCNPYLAMAACLACGYLGMKQKLSPRPEAKGVAYDMPHELPNSVLEGLELLEANKELQEVLGEDFCKIYIALKQEEHSEYLRVISPWERQHLLLNV